MLSTCCLNVSWVAHSVLSDRHQLLSVSLTTEVDDTGRSNTHVHRLATIYPSEQTSIMALGPGCNGLCACVLVKHQYRIVLMHASTMLYYWWLPAWNLKLSIGAASDSQAIGADLFFTVEIVTGKVISGQECLLASCLMSKQCLLIRCACWTQSTTLDFLHSHY